MYVHCSVCIGAILSPYIFNWEEGEYGLGVRAYACCIIPDSVLRIAEIWCEEVPVFRLIN